MSLRLAFFILFGVRILFWYSESWRLNLLFFLIVGDWIDRMCFEFRFLVKKTRTYFHWGDDLHFDEFLVLKVSYSLWHLAKRRARRKVVEKINGSTSDPSDIKLITWVYLKKSWMQVSSTWLLHFLLTSLLYNSTLILWFLNWISNLPPKIIAFLLKDVNSIFRKKIFWFKIIIAS